MSDREPGLPLSADFGKLLRQPFRARRRHEATPNGQRLHHRQLILPVAQQEARRLQAGSLSRPLSMRHDRFETLQFRERLRRGRLRFTGSFGDVLHREPHSMPQWIRVRRLRTTVRKNGTDRPRQAFRGRPLDHAARRPRRGRRWNEPKSGRKREHRRSKRGFAGPGDCGR